MEEEMSTNGQLLDGSLSFTVTPGPSLSKPSAPAPSAQPGTFTVSKEGTFAITFGQTITKQIDELITHMRKSGVERKDVVFTSLQLFALSFENDLTIESARRKGSLRISDLWKPEYQP